jgi:hypothetical protein
VWGVTSGLAGSRSVDWMEESVWVAVESRSGVIPDHLT